MSGQGTSPATDRELLLEIHRAVGLIGERQQATDKRLFGNGQPGELAKLDERIKDLEIREAEGRGAAGANKRWAGAISAGVSALLTWALETLAHRHQ